jgi:REP element-mobilizing transposase RayT
MAHMFANLLTHSICSIEGRSPLLTPEIRPDMPAYLDGIIRKLDGRVIESNTRPGHVHCLLSPLRG